MMETLVFLQDKLTNTVHKLLLYIGFFQYINFEKGKEKIKQKRSSNNDPISMKIKMNAVGFEIT
jgi:hypothetical protein